MVGVLVLVDEDMAEPPLVERRDVRERAEQVDRLADEVVEVEGVGAREALRILAKDLDEHALGGVAEVRSPRVGLHVLQLVLELGDASGGRAHGEPQGVGVEVLDDPLEERPAVGRVVDGEALREPEILGFASQDSHARGVEGGDPHALGGLADDLVHAFAHLRGRLVREGDREDLARPRLARLEQPGDATREHTRLARAGSGDDEECGAAVFDGDALLWIEAGEQGGFGL